MGSGLRRRQFLAISAGAALAKVLAGTGSPVRAQGLTSLNVGLSFINLDGVPAWIAQDKHFFEKYGLNVTILSFQGGARAMAALAAGDVPIALLGGADVIGARSQGFPVKMIAGIINSIPFDFLVTKNITSPSQLKGTKGAISSFGGSSDFAVRYALTKLGVSPSDVTLLQVGNEASRLASLQSGQIQFTVLTAGLDLEAIDIGFKPMLKLYEFNQSFQHTGVAVNTDWAKTHGHVIDSFLKAIVTADVWIKNPLNVAAAIALIHPHLPIKEGNLKLAFQLYRDKFYQVYPLVTVPGMEFILKERKINQPVADFYDNSYVQTLQAANFAQSVAKSL